MFTIVYTLCHMCTKVYVLVQKRMFIYKCMVVYMCQHAHTHPYIHLCAYKYRERKIVNSEQSSMFLSGICVHLSIWQFLLWNNLASLFQHQKDRPNAARLRRTLSQMMTKEFLLISRGTKVSMYKSMLLGSKCIRQQMVFQNLAHEYAN